MTDQPIRLAIVGGGRGGAFRQVMHTLADRIRLVAFYDTREDVMEQWKTMYPDLMTFPSYAHLLDSAAIDAVFIATPFPLHTEQAIAALRAGKHVLSEVIATTSIEESWALVEAVEQTGLTYMMAENCVFTRPNMMISNMVARDAFGEISYAEGGYIHDVRHLMHHSSGELTWRGRLRRDVNGVVYPTHSLGPIAQWLGMNEPDGDSFESMTTFVSKEVANHHYFRELFGSDHPGAERSYWSQGDSAIALIRTKRGVLIQLRYDVKSPRPIQGMHYALQGANGAYQTGRFAAEDPIVWLSGRSPGTSPFSSREQEAKWEPLWNYADEYEHPQWKKWKSALAQAGHGGSDFFVLEEFSSAIAQKRKPLIDVYDAVTWSSVYPLSVQSIQADGRPVPFVSFYPRR